MAHAIIVDDSPIVRTQLRQILTRIGCTVDAEAASGDQVRELYEKYRPDLITMDIVMPGKDGVTASTELLRDFPAAKIVMCTSIASREKILACQARGRDPLPPQAVRAPPAPSSSFASRWPRPTR